jgi:phosphatidylserine decarboxylase
MTIARSGLREILIATGTIGAGAVVGVWAALDISSWYWFLAGPLLVAWLSVVAFFRDPRRSVPDAPGLLVSPADGRVTEITRLEEYPGMDGPALRIGVFLSIFDVHINRAPCAGRVIDRHYRRGQFLDARHPESGARNEANTFVIEPQDGIPGPVVVRQIAGTIARRIVCNVQPGDTVERGHRVGLIKFGSRTELIVPADGGLKPVVRVGDHVRAGSSVVMRMDNCPESGAGLDDRDRN